MGDPLERLGSEAAASMGWDSDMKADLCIEIEPPLQENVATAEDWRKALNKVVPAVVVLRTTACRAFDTECAGASYATGFVVDKRRGIIVTNRHVVKPGAISQLLFRQEKHWNLVFKFWAFIRKLGPSNKKHATYLLKPKYALYKLEVKTFLSFLHIY